MKTKIIERKEIEQAIECLKMGGVVAFPTDTVYGLGVIYDELEALERLKLSKGRPEEKPIPMMIGSKEQLETVAFTNEKVERLIEAFMPGGFTIILKKKACVSDQVTNGFDTIALRMPDDAFILEMIRRIGKPLLVTSANLSGQPTGVYFDDVKKDFDGRIDMIVKGECKGSVSSTIIDATDGQLKMVRQGPIHQEDIVKEWEGRK